MVSLNKKKEGVIVFMKKNRVIEKEKKAMNYAKNKMLKQKEI